MATVLLRPLQGAMAGWVDCCSVTVGPVPPVHPDKMAGPVELLG